MTKLLLKTTILSILASIVALSTRAEERELSISFGDRLIYGISSTSNSAPAHKHGVAIVSHGFNGTHHFARDYFNTLNSLGYEVYTFDYPDGSVYSRSGNNTMNMSVITQKEALKTIVSHFMSQENIDKDRIILIGESQGGFISGLAAAELGNNISGLILIYPAFIIADNWNSHYPDIAAIPDTTKLWDVPLGRKFFMELRDINISEAMESYKGPVMIVQGDADVIVPLDSSIRAKKIYPDAELKIIPGAGHGFNHEQRIISNQYVADFLKRRIN